MARLAFWVALAVTVAVVLGCGPAKELPDEVPNSDPRDQGPVIPTKSLPAAKEYVEKAVKAYTGGKPELVAKGKFSRLVRKGEVRLPVGAGDGGAMQKAPVDTTRTIAAVWPDRFTFTDETRGEGKRPNVTAYLHRPRLVIVSNNQSINLENAGETELTLAADAVGQHWMTLMLPLTDPKAVVFDLRSRIGVGANGQQVSLQMLLLSIKGFPLYQLTFDANTHALLQVEYEVKESGHPVQRTWMMIDHKASPEGLLLPTKMACRWNNDPVLVEKWEEVKWEFPAAIDDTEFSPPKK